MSAGPSCTTCVTAPVKPPRSKRSVSADPPSSRSLSGVTTEDLENYEADRELQLPQEYRDVAKMFRYAVETERRFYLANEVDVEVLDSNRPMVEVRLRDAWVWDMYR